MWAGGTRWQTGASKRVDTHLEELFFFEQGQVTSKGLELLWLRIVATVAMRLWETC